MAGHKNRFGHKQGPVLKMWKTKGEKSNASKQTEIIWFSGHARKEQGANQLYKYIVIDIAPKVEIQFVGAIPRRNWTEFLLEAFLRLRVFMAAYKTNNTNNNTRKWG